MPSSAQNHSKNLPLRTLLRNATHHQHVCLNSHPLLSGLMHSGYSLSNYQTLLCTYFNLYTLLEQRIQAFINNQPEVFDHNQRYKVPWLLKDLAYFNLAPKTLSQSTIHFLNIETIGQLIGVLYVVEGSTLGAAHISKSLAKHHGYTQDAGSCFFTGYGENTPPFWQSFIVFSATISDDSQQCQAAVEAASQTFELFKQVLDHAVHQTSTTKP